MVREEVVLDKDGSAAFVRRESDPAIQMLESRILAAYYGWALPQVMPSPPPKHPRPGVVLVLRLRLPDFGGVPGPDRTAQALLLALTERAQLSTVALSRGDLRAREQRFREAVTVTPAVAAAYEPSLEWVYLDLYWAGREGYPPAALQDDPSAAADEILWCMLLHERIMDVFHQANTMLWLPGYRHRHTDGIAFTRWLPGHTVPYLNTATRGTWESWPNALVPRRVDW